MFVPFFWSFSCSSLPCAEEPSTGHSTSDVAPPVQSRGAESLPLPSHAFPNASQDIPGFLATLAHAYLVQQQVVLACLSSMPSRRRTEADWKWKLFWKILLGSSCCGYVVYVWYISSFWIACWGSRTFMIFTASTLFRFWCFFLH